MQALDETSLQHFEIEDKAMESRLIQSAETNGFDRTELPSPMFTCSRGEFTHYLSGNKRPHMANFYKQRRKALNILIEKNGEPIGGRWSFDTENRRKLPKGLVPPEISWPEPDAHVAAVIEIVERQFPDHPGSAREFRWPTTREQALKWLDEFIAERLVDFGPYEDAMTSTSTSVFHSLLSPFMNLGLLTPGEILDRVLAADTNVPMQSLEGFVRQVIGWREFIRGVYRHFGDEQEQANFWSHDRGLTPSWYDGTTGIPPLDDAIHVARKLGWAHHIQRLMVLGNLMTLCEIRPTTAHRWFMEMFVDSSEWVMGPNVYGMALFSDGGIFATKPYICGSNYLLKMSDYKKGSWCDTVDGLHWRFIDKHRDFFAGNARLALMPRALDRLADDRKQRIFTAAEAFLAEHTDVSD
jgi:deoxyribodipyrimidine photolyase-related protein